MRRARRGASLARYAAPAAFLAAATIAVLLVRAALRDDAPTRPSTTSTTQTTVATTGTERAPTVAGTNRAPDPRRFYRIQAGDTLADVAERFGTTVDRLLALNPEIDPIALRVGQRIRVR